MPSRVFSANTVRTVGALLPSDVLSKILDGEGLAGITPDDYGLDGIRLRDAVNDAWNELKPLWWELQRELKNLPDTDLAATTVTREKWLIPLLKVLGFDDLNTQARAIGVGGSDYPISHIYKHSPVHLMGARAELDTRVAGIPGAARLSPHSLVQQFLNRSDDHLWGIVANGNELRLLRDSVSLTRQAFVEFDLAAMFNGEVYTDFNLLYRTIHATRFHGGRPEDALLEAWVRTAREDGTRARDRLRDGVQMAIESLGSGFLRNPNNDALRESILTGETTEVELYKHLLRLIYRLLFLFVAEDRDLLHPEGTAIAIRDRYSRFYSATRLRELSGKPTATRHDDLWHSLKTLMDVLARDEGEPHLGLPGLGSFLWQQDTIGQLQAAGISNHHLLRAILHLSHTQQDQTRRRVDYSQLGAEELGSIYESLLELHPKIDSESRSFTLDGGAGSERKTTGSYYTPTSLISELLDTALDPVLERAAMAENPEEAILDLKIVDPACGSGHFLLAAGNRVAKRLAEIRTGEPEPSIEHVRTALRDVISRCIFAVDMNELAVELCKVSLWIETLEPGKPLSFLDHHILVGNSLFGATPASIEQGIPNEAFRRVAGDNSDVVRKLGARNRKELKARQAALVFGAGTTDDLAAEIQALEEFGDVDLESVRVKESMLAEWKASRTYRGHRFLADAWCAAFAIEKVPGNAELTSAVFDGMRGGTISSELDQAIQSLADKYKFFHWHVEFPQVFKVEAGGARSGGFDVVLGNPPWERVKLQEKEFFGPHAPEIAKAPNKAKRQRLIDRLPEDNPDLWNRFQVAVREAETTSHFLRDSGVFPLCGRGDVNTYTVFAELMRSLVSDDGRVGVIVPSGIATDDTTKHFFSDLVEQKSLHSLYDFENRNAIFAGVHRSFKFCLLTMTGPSAPVGEAEFVFFALDTVHLADEDRRFTLTPEDFALLNPNTRTCPVFRTRRDAEITKAIYRKVPVLIDDNKPDGNPWGVKFSTMFHMSNDSHLFKTREELESDGWTLEGNHFVRGEERYLPLYEGKMIHHFDHRWATYDDGDFRNVTLAEKQNPEFVAQPRYWVPKPDVDLRSDGRSWSFGYRDIARPTDERTLIASPFPYAAVSNKLPQFTSDVSLRTMTAVLDTFVADFCARQKVGGSTLNYFYVKQFPVPGPAQVSSSLVRDIVLELCYTANDMTPFAMAFGPAGAPFRWTVDRRSLLRSELDALMFVQHELDSAAVAHVLDTFPIVRRHDIAEHGSYRTKGLILDAYDRMMAAKEAGVPYETQIDPPPADPSLAHPSTALS